MCTKGLLKSKLVKLGIISIFLSFFLLSCKNFLNGSDFLEQLEHSVEYENAQAYTVLVSCDEGTGTIVTGLGENNLKVTDTLAISFSKAKTYKFIEWQAVQKDNTAISMEDYISFGDKTALETSITLIKAPETEILIKPYCESSLSLVESYPVDSDEGVPRDSTIKLVLSSPLSQNCDLSKIQISIVGSNVDGRLHFETPILDKKQLIIVAKKENRISVIGDDIKSIAVTIPEDFTYIGKNGEEIVIGEELTHNYRINSKTSDKAFITFGSEDEDAGIFKVNGISSNSVTQQYSIGEKITVTFKVKDGYVFDGWECSNEEAIYLKTSEVTEESDENGFNAETQTATAELLIINEATNVTFKALFHKIPSASIQGTSNEYGTYTYDINKPYYEGRGGTLGFTANSDYQFIRWMVWNAKANNGEGAEVANGTYITIDKPNSANTTFTLTQAPATDSNVELWLKPLCAKRPKVVSVTPLYDSNGVYRDRRIIVMFNKPMDDASIYFDEKEIPEGMRGIPSTKASGKYYAYWDGHDSQTLVFKTISITKRNDPNYNLLSCYNEPYFDSTDKSVLRIDTKQGEVAPPGATEISVTIKSQIGCKLENTLVNLSGDYEWAYYTNGKTDKDPPEFAKNGTDDFTVLFAEAGQTENVSTTQLLTSFAGDTQPDVYKANNLKSETIWVKGRFYDTGSGPKLLKWNLYKVNDKYYPTDETKITDGQIDELEITGADAVIKSKVTNAQGQTTPVDGTAVKLPLTEKDEGLYRIDFICTDKNEKSSETLSYYFVHDKVGPKSSSLLTVNKTYSKDKIDVKLTKNDNWDYARSEVKDSTKDNDSKKPISNGSTVTFENSGSSSRTYEIKLYDYDIFGNVTETLVNLKSVPSVGMIYYTDGYWSTEYMSTKTPLGVICNTDDLSKVRIYDLTEFNNIHWGSSANKPGVTEYCSYYNNKKDNYGTDGLVVYNGYVKDKYNTTEYSTKTNEYTYIWGYIKNIKNIDSPVTWYVPDIKEVAFVSGENYSVIEATMAKLRENGIDATIGNTEVHHWCARPTCWERANTYKPITGLDQVRDGNDGSNLALWKDGHKEFYTHCMAQVNLE